MKVIKGDLLDPTPDVDAVCVTTNLQRRRDGTAVMGAGIALAAHKKWNLHADLGVLLHLGVKETVVIKRVGVLHIVAVPTKDHWKENSSIELIEKSLKELVHITTHERNWLNVWVPSMGTNNGRLSTDLVWPVMHKYLDDRFTMVLKG